MLTCTLNVVPHYIHLGYRLTCKRKQLLLKDLLAGVFILFSKVLPKGIILTALVFLSYINFSLLVILSLLYLMLWVISDLVIIKNCNLFLISPQLDFSLLWTSDCYMCIFQFFSPFSKWDFFYCRSTIFPHHCISEVHLQLGQVEIADTMSFCSKVDVPQGAHTGCSRKQEKK